ncbi:hypothetical protein J6590_103410, partial [Homalodisca vitripennis]
MHTNMRQRDILQITVGKAAIIPTRNPIINSQNNSGVARGGEGRAPKKVTATR